MIVKADTLPRINISRTKIICSIANAIGMFVKHTRLAIQRFPDQNPYAVNFSEISLNKKTTQTYIFLTFFESRISKNHYLSTKLIPIYKNIRKGR